MSINSVAITGNLTRDPELRQTASGASILSFSVAVNDRRQNQNGEWVDYPNYIDCVIFGNRAESVSRFISKGSKVTILGKLRWSQWSDKDGNKRTKLEVVVDDIEFMTARQETQPPQYRQARQQPPQYQAQQPPQYQQPQQAQPQYPMYEEDIPF